MVTKYYLVDGIHVECRLSNDIEDVGFERSKQLKAENKFQAYCLYNVGEDLYWITVTVTEEMMAKEKFFDEFMVLSIKHQMKKNLKPQ